MSILGFENNAFDFEPEEAHAPETKSSTKKSLQVKISSSSPPDTTISDTKKNILSSPSFTEQPMELSLERRRQSSAAMVEYIIYLKLYISVCTACQL